MSAEKNFGVILKGEGLKNPGKKLFKMQDQILPDAQDDRQNQVLHGVQDDRVVSF